jgi:GrxC family glutaredoxin
MMKNIQIYSTQQCPYCVRAKALLQAKTLPYEEVDVTTDMVLLQEMMQRSGNRSVPQIFIDGESVGGFQELSQMNASGNL